MSRSIDDAIELVVGHAGRQEVVTTPLEDALGLVLAAEVVSDVDSPPFDKALMDGYAVRSADLQGGRAELRVLGELLAGGAADRPVDPGTAWQIMTGAPIPPGADAVVIVERSRRVEPDVVVLEDPAFAPRQNVMKRATELQRDEEVLAPGHVIGPAEIGLMATVGHTRPLVHRRPRVAIISTGDEIVPPDQTPGPGQIRNSNDLTLRALARRAGCEVLALGIARDNLDELLAKIRQGLEADVVILNGGVSAGKKDLVPGALASLGVHEVFHKVEFKPGKPIWFGVKENRLAFGLPGNPVSALVCFELFVRTALRARQSHPRPRPVHVPARLADDVDYRASRLTYHPAQLWSDEESWWVKPVTWHGSPDLRALVSANALVVIPPSSQPLAAGAIQQVLPLPGAP